MTPGVERLRGPKCPPELPSEWRFLAHHNALIDSIDQRAFVEVRASACAAAKNAITWHALKP
jgi:hypothetical protein